MEREDRTNAMNSVKSNNLEISIIYAIKFHR